MLSRVLLNTIGRLFPRTKPAPTNWQEAYESSQEDIKSLTKRVEDLQRAIQQWSEELNKPNRLAITQATIDASTVGATERGTGAFSTLGVGQAVPTAAGYRAIIGDGAGREWLSVDGGSSGNDGGPGVVFAYGGSAIQGIGGYSSLLGGAFDKRLTLYSESFDLVIGHASNSYAVNFANPADGAAAQVGTLTNAPSAGNPVYWLKIKIAGNVRYIPCWS